VNIRKDACYFSWMLDYQEVHQDVVRIWIHGPKIDVFLPRGLIPQFHEAPNLFKIY